MGGPVGGGWVVAAKLVARLLAKALSEFEFRHPKKSQMGDISKGETNMPELPKKYKKRF